MRRGKTLWMCGMMAVVFELSLAAERGSSDELRLAVTQLRCEYLVDPLGVDVAKPRLSWVLESDIRGQKQTAYRILVASSRAALADERGDVWDSGKVQSAQTAQVAYAGKPLASRMSCWWKVQAWDQDDKPCEWSQPAHWSMGLLRPEEWYGAVDQPSEGGPAQTKHAT